MAKLTLSDLTSGYSAVAVINANNALIEAALENTLSLDGTEPNVMDDELDMGGFRITNLAEPTSSTDAVRLVDVANIVAGGDINISATVAWDDVTSVPALVDDIGDLSDPGGDRILFWDDSAGIVTFLTAGTGIDITGTTISSSVSSVAWDDITSVPALVDDIGDLSDPGADRLLFWDDSAGNVAFLTASTGLAITTTSIALSHLGIQNLTDPNADRILFWDDSAGVVTWLTAGGGLTITGTSIETDMLGIQDLSDPGADRIIFWDDSAGAAAFLSVGTGLAITTTTLDLNATLQSFGALTDPGADRITFWDDSAGNYADLEPTGHLSITGTQIAYASTTGSFTGTLTGVTGQTGNTIKYSINDNVVTLEFEAITGTSNSTAHTITGAPAALFPATQQRVLAVTTEAGTDGIAFIYIETTGVITLYTDINEGAFTAAGTDGIVQQTIHYHLS